MSDIRDIRPLIDADELARAIGSAHPPVLLDVRWAAGQVQRDGYLAGHIPGAIFLDLDRDLAAPPGVGGRHPLPEASALQAVWRRVGISDDSAVVVYDSRDSAIAARAWWLLRWSGLTDVKVLDGGFAGWSADPGRAVDEGETPDPEPGTVTVSPGQMSIVDADGAASLATGAGILLDVRAASRYSGEIEPLDPIAGHIPGSVNLPLTDLLRDDGTFLTDAEIVEKVEAVIGSHGSEQVAASCGSGVTACHLILAGALVGRKIALYPGSYSGWLALRRPVVVGPEPGGC